METASTSRIRLLERVRHALDNSAAAQSVNGRVRLQVLFSTPRQARDLYPYAHVDADDASKTARSHSVEAYVEQVFMTASFTPPSVSVSSGGKESIELEEPRLIYALECFLYTLPKHQSAVLYVSKLDTSGWGPTLPARHLQPYLLSRQHERDASNSSSAPLEASTSITRVITEAFVRHFACLDHWAADDRLARVQHLSLHILARAQGAYLFPSSNENKTKHILSDGHLIKWWRSVVTSVAQRTKESGLNVRSYYTIPGYDRLESHQLVPLPSASSGWTYGHPYSLDGAGVSVHASLPPLPLSGPHFGDPTSETAAPSSVQKSLLNRDHIATLLPHFPDDPKSRFIAELARDAHEHVGSSLTTGIPPTKKRAIAAKTSGGSGGGGGVVASASPLESQRVLRSATPTTSPTKGRSATPSTPPPASAASLRRTGSRSATSSPSPVKLTSSQRQLMRERLALNHVSADEFWTRMAFRQECCSGNAVGVFVALFTRLAPRKAELSLLSAASAMTNGDERKPADMLRAASASSLTGTNSGTTGRSMPGQPLSLPHQMLQDIIFKRLMIDACDWSSAKASIDLSRAWEQAIGQALQRKGNLKGVLGEAKGEAETQMNPAYVGKGVVWDVVEMRGPTASEVARAEQEWRANGGKTNDVVVDAGNVQADVPQQPVVNVLSVKRKKRA